jgi:hypothetical protein
VSYYGEVSTRLAIVHGLLTRRPAMEHQRTRSCLSACVAFFLITTVCIVSAPPAAAQYVPEMMIFGEIPLCGETAGHLRPLFRDRATFEAELAAGRIIGDKKRGAMSETYLWLHPSLIKEDIQYGGVGTDQIAVVVAKDRVLSVGAHFSADDDATFDRIVEGMRRHYTRELGRPPAVFFEGAIGWEDPEIETVIGFHAESRQAVLTFTCQYLFNELADDMEQAEGE